MQEQDTIIEDTGITLEDVTAYSDEDPSVLRLLNFVMERYTKAEDTRRTEEERWLQAYRNYRGLYSPEVQFTEAERSRVFIKVTKTKTLAAYGQIVDVLFAGQRFPLSVEPTILPEGVVEAVNFDPQKPEGIEDEGIQVGESPYGFAGDGKEDYGSARGI